MKNILKEYWYRIVFYLVIIFYVLNIGVIKEPDTGSYLNLSIIASPGYPSFLYPFKKLLNEDIFLISVVVTQLVINIASILYVISVISKRFGIYKVLVVGLDVVLLSPLFISDFLVANRITSEALAYPLMLLIVTYLMEGLFAKRSVFFKYMLFALFIGLAVRTQFFFILPVLVVVLGYFLITTRSFRLYGWGLLFVLFMPLFVSIVDKTFHYAVVGRFENTSNTGVQVITIPFYVADKEDYLVYEDKNIQEYFKYVYKQALDSTVLDDFYKPKFNDNVYRHFHDNYARLSFEVLSIKGRGFLNPSEPDNVDTIIGNNKLLISMVLPLFWDNFSKCVDLYFKNIIHAFGGLHILWLYLMVAIGTLLIWLKKKNKIALFSFILMLLAFSNISIVCMVEHSLDRFMIYHRWMLPVVFILLLNEIYKEKGIPEKTNLVDSQPVV